MASGVRILGAFLDTLVINVSPTDANEQVERRDLPAELKEELTTWKELAQEEEEDFPTRFLFRGLPLKMKAKGGDGFNWILHNDYITLAVNRSAKMLLWAQVRYSSRYLWSVRDLGALLVEVHTLLVAHFGRQIRLDVSACDLAVDVTGLDLGSIHDVKRHFISRAQLNDEYPLHTDGMIDGPDGVKLRWGRITGLPFGSRTGAVSALIYDKTHEIKYNSPAKAWFYDLWAASARAQGLEWTEDMQVWRVEVRFKRQALHEMKQEGVFWGIDDAYELERHMPGLWAYAVGHLDGGADGLPDGWLRYVIPNENDSTRSRWLVHPDWEVIQSAFEPVAAEETDFEREQREKEELLQEVDAYLEAHPMSTPNTVVCRRSATSPSVGVVVVPDPVTIDLTPYVRKRKRRKNMRAMMAQVIGCTATFEAWHGSTNGGDVEPDLSSTFHALYRMGEAYLLEQGRDFVKMVQKKRVLYEVERAVA